MSKRGPPAHVPNGPTVTKPHGNKETKDAVKTPGSKKSVGEDTPEKGRDQIFAGFADKLVAGGKGSEDRERDFEKKSTQALYKETVSKHNGQVYIDDLPSNPDKWPESRFFTEPAEDDVPMSGFFRDPDDNKIYCYPNNGKHGIFSGPDRDEARFGGKTIPPGTEVAWFETKSCEHRLGVVMAPEKNDQGEYQFEWSEKYGYIGKLFFYGGGEEEKTAYNSGRYPFSALSLYRGRKQDSVRIQVKGADGNVRIPAGFKDPTRIPRGHPFQSEGITYVSIGSSLYDAAHIGYPIDKKTGQLLDGTTEGDWCLIPFEKIDDMTPEIIELDKLLFALRTKPTYDPLAARPDDCFEMEEDELTAENYLKANVLIDSPACDNEVGSSKNSPAKEEIDGSGMPMVNTQQARASRRLLEQKKEVMVRCELDLNCEPAKAPDTADSSKGASDKRRMETKVTKSPKKVNDVPASSDAKVLALEEKVDRLDNKITANFSELSGNMEKLLAMGQQPVKQMVPVPDPKANPVVGFERSQPVWFLEHVSQKHPTKKLTNNCQIPELRTPENFDPDSPLFKCVEFFDALWKTNNLWFPTVGPLDDDLLDVAKFMFWLGAPLVSTINEDFVPMVEDFELYRIAIVDDLKDDIDALYAKIQPLIGLEDARYWGWDDAPNDESEQRTHRFFYVEDWDEYNKHRSFVGLQKNQLVADQVKKSGPFTRKETCKIADAAGKPQQVDVVTKSKQVDVCTKPKQADVGGKTKQVDTSVGKTRGNTAGGKQQRRTADGGGKNRQPAASSRELRAKAEGVKKKPLGRNICGSLQLILGEDPGSWDWSKIRQYAENTGKLVSIPKMGRLSIGELHLRPDSEGNMMGKPLHTVPGLTNAIKQFFDPDDVQAMKEIIAKKLASVSKPVTAQSLFHSFAYRVFTKYFVERRIAKMENESTVMDVCQDAVQELRGTIDFNVQSFRLRNFHPAFWVGLWVMVTSIDTMSSDRQDLLKQTLQYVCKNRKRNLRQIRINDAKCIDVAIRKTADPTVRKLLAASDVKKSDSDELQSDDSKDKRRRHRGGTTKFAGIPKPIDVKKKGGPVWKKEKNPTTVKQAFTKDDILFDDPNEDDLVEGPSVNDGKRKSHKRKKRHSSFSDSSDSDEDAEKQKKKPKKSHLSPTPGDLIDGGRSGELSEGTPEPESDAGSSEESSDEERDGSDI